MAAQGQLTHKVNGVSKTYFFHELGDIDRLIHKINTVSEFYYFPKTVNDIATWLDDGSGAISNPWDDSQFWNE